jgi:hypothetical protein
MFPSQRIDTHLTLFLYLDATDIEKFFFVIAQVYPPLLLRNLMIRLEHPSLLISKPQLRDCEIDPLGKVCALFAYPHNLVIQFAYRVELVFFCARQEQQNI